MIYVDTSVVLAQLFAEDRRPPRRLWDDSLVSSRLIEYETWSRLHARRLADSHGPAARDILARIAMVELSPLVLARALEPFPSPVRTLDAVHLATLHYLRGQRLAIRLATYDVRMRAVAKRLGASSYALT